MFRPPSSPYYRTAPGAGARPGHPQKRERARRKPAEGPAAEKRDHGGDVPAEGERSAAVSAAGAGGPGSGVGSFTDVVSGLTGG